MITFKTKIPLLLSLLAIGTTISYATSTIVLDQRNHIYWQDTPASKQSSKDWEEANSYCQQLQLHGFRGWRLPTFQELLSIVDFGKVKPAILDAFDYTAEETYWTATPFAANPSRAWTIDFRSGLSYYSYKTTNHTVRCVKDIPTKEKSQ